MMDDPLRSKAVEFSHRNLHAGFRYITSMASLPLPASPGEKGRAAWRRNAGHIGAAADNAMTIAHSVFIRGWLSQPQSVNLSREAVRHFCGSIFTV